MEQEYFGWEPLLRETNGTAMGVVNFLYQRGSGGEASFIRKSDGRPEQLFWPMKVTAETDVAQLTRVAKAAAFLHQEGAVMDYIEVNRWIANALGQTPIYEFLENSPLLREIVAGYITGNTGADVEAPLNALFVERIDRGMIVRKGDMVALGENADAVLKELSALKDARNRHLLNVRRTDWVPEEKPNGSDRFGIPHWKLDEAPPLSGSTSYRPNGGPRVGAQCGSVVMTRPVPAVRGP
jgi:hypothetical protein